MSTAEQRAERKATGQGAHTPRIWRVIAELRTRIQERDARIHEQDSIIADLLERLSARGKVGEA